MELTILERCYLSGCVINRHYPPIQAAVKVGDCWDVSGLYVACSSGRTLRLTIAENASRNFLYRFCT